MAGSLLGRSLFDAQRLLFPRLFLSCLSRVVFRFLFLVFALWGLALGLVSSGD